MPPLKNYIKIFLKATNIIEEMNDSNQREKKKKTKQQHLSVCTRSNYFGLNNIVAGKMY